MKRFTRPFDKLIHLLIPDRFAKVARYLIAGSAAAVTNLVSLYFFTSILQIWYIISTVLAFIIAFIVSFTLQKFWTFTDSSTERWKSQATLYLAITSTNLGLNTLLMYIAVDYLHIHYLVAQFFISGLIAVESYFVYQIFVFKKSRTHDISSQYGSVVSTD